MHSREDFIRATKKFTTDQNLDREAELHPSLKECKVAVMAAARSGRTQREEKGEGTKRLNKWPLRARSTLGLGEVKFPQKMTRRGGGH